MLLQVPGLPEGRPALVLGDNVFLRSAQPPLPPLLSATPGLLSAVLLLSCMTDYKLPMAPYCCVPLHIVCVSQCSDPFWY